MLDNFPYTYDIILSFHPLQPLPCTVPIELVFNDQSGKLRRGGIESLEMGLADILLPMPVPSSIPDKGACLQQLFAELWQEIMKVGTRF